jgi:hypothetical protein
MIQEGCQILHSKIHKLIIVFGIRKHCLISGRSLSLYQFTRMVIKLIVVIIEGYHCYQLRTKFYPVFFPQGYFFYYWWGRTKSTRYCPCTDEIIGDRQCGFRHNRSTTDQIFGIRQILEKNGSTMRQYISYS